MASQFTNQDVTLPPRRRESRWIRRALVFATVVLLVDALFGERGLRETLQARERFARAQAELEALRHENAALQARVRLLDRDPRTIEFEARRELGLVKPGEVLFVVRTR